MSFLLIVSDLFLGTFDRIAMEILACILYPPVCKMHLLVPTLSSKTGGA